MSEAVTTTEGRSVTADMADRFGMTTRNFQEVLAETVLPSRGQGSNMAEVAAFLLVARQYDLNPFTKEIYAFPNRGGGIVPVVGVDGWISLVNRQASMDGVSFQMEDDQDGAPVSCTCSIYRKDRSHPTVVTEYMAEVARKTDPWRTMPRRMLRHKALIQCARVAFGLSGIYDEDEAHDIAHGRRPEVVELSSVTPRVVEEEGEPEGEEIEATPAEGPRDQVIELGVAEGTARAPKIGQDPKIIAALWGDDEEYEEATRGH